MQRVDTSAWIEWLTREIGEDQAERVIAFTQNYIGAELDMVIAQAAGQLVQTSLLTGFDSEVGTGRSSLERHQQCNSSIPICIHNPNNIRPWWLPTG